MDGSTCSLQAILKHSLTSAVTSNIPSSRKILVFCTTAYFQIKIHMSLCVLESGVQASVHMMSGLVIFRIFVGRHLQSCILSGSVGSQFTSALCHMLFVPLRVDFANVFKVQSKSVHIKHSLRGTNLRNNPLGRASQCLHSRTLVPQPPRPHSDNVRLARKGMQTRRSSGKKRVLLRILDGQGRCPEAKLYGTFTTVCR